MVGQNLRAQGNGVPCGNGGVGPNLQGQLIIVGHIAHTGVFHGVVHLVNRRVDGIDGDDADHGLGSLVPVSGDIAAAMAHGDLHVQGGVGTQGGNVQIGVEDFHLAVCLDIPGRHLTGAHCVDIHSFHPGAVELGNDPLHAEYDLSDVFLDAGNGGELMLDAGDLDGGRSRAGQRGQQNPSQGVTQSGAVAPFQRFHHILAIRGVFGRIHAHNARLFNFYHE